MMANSLALVLSAIAMIAVETAPLNAQATAAATSPAIAVSIALQKDKVPVGEAPWVVLTVKNLSDRDLAINDAWRIHVEGEKGEPPKTGFQDIVTLSAPWTIAARETSVHTYNLAHFYRLSQAGKYTVYMEVSDPLSHKWLRTNTEKFEIRSPTQ